MKFKHGEFFYKTLKNLMSVFPTFTLRKIVERQLCYGFVELSRQVINQTQLFDLVFL